MHPKVSVSSESSADSPNLHLVDTVVLPTCPHNSNQPTRHDANIVVHTTNAHHNLTAGKAQAEGKTQAENQTEM